MRPLGFLVGLFGIALVVIYVPIGMARRSEPQVQRLTYVVGNVESAVVVARADGSQQRVKLGQPNGRGPAVWSPDGVWIAAALYTNQGRNVVLMSASGNTWSIVTQRPDSQYSYGTANWSPDSQYLASTYGFIYRDIQGVLTPQYGLHVIAADGTNERSLTSVRDEASFPAWSPDGHWIAYVSRLGGQPSIFRIRPDGTGREQLTAEEVSATYPVWSPDGEWIAYLAWSTLGVQDLWIMRPDGSDQRQIYITSDTMRPTPTVIEWSPDGQQLLFHSFIINNWKFVVADIDGGVARIVVNSLVQAADWSPDGRWIAYSAGIGRDARIYRVRPDGTGTQQLTTDPIEAHNPQYAPIINHEWSPLRTLVLAMLSGISYLVLSSVSLFSKWLMIIGSSLSSN